MRTVAWFSAGAASAVATKLAISEDPATVVARVDTRSELRDNARFADDCAEWFGRPIQLLSSSDYVDTWDVWRRRRFIVGQHGAQCTVVLKKRVRQQFEQPGDRQVFGYTAEEQGRVDRFKQANPDVDIWTPLIERGLTKSDCLAMVERAGIELPLTYRLGFANANCIPCPHGGMGYFNRIRRHFPAEFDRMARMEREVGHACNKDENGPVWLDELDPDRGSDDEPIGECSLLCVLAEDDMNSQDPAARRQGDA
jgi:3'-phosphoadenosine 5'-phosphosulfate sulfotransferase (PAPS reductase)/FAD synthetase